MLLFFLIVFTLSYDSSIFTYDSSPGFILVSYVSNLSVLSSIVTFTLQVFPYLSTTAGYVIHGFNPLKSSFHSLFEPNSSISLSQLGL